MWSALERDLPEAALLEGPKGVGKFTGAMLLAEKHAGYEEMSAHQGVTVQDVRDLVEWFGYRASSRRIAVLEPGPCHPNVWGLLKTLLESLPPRSHVWLVGSYEYPVPSGIRDRCFTYQLGLLTPDEMQGFLEEAETATVDPEYTEALGSADTVLEMNRALSVKPAVANWVRAVEDCNRAELYNSTRAWEPRHTQLLIAEISEQLQGASLLGGVQFRRVRRDKLLTALTLLHDGKDAAITALGTGLSMMPKSP